MSEAIPSLDNHSRHCGRQSSAITATTIHQIYTHLNYPAQLVAVAIVPKLTQSEITFHYNAGPVDSRMINREGTTR